MNGAEVKKKYPWSGWNGLRADLIMMGNPDCHCYIVKYVAADQRALYGNAYCWTLNMPRGSDVRFTGFAASLHGAKRQAEATIEKEWC